jgi:uncharacterized protein (DUF2342 family)
VNAFDFNPFKPALPRNLDVVARGWMADHAKKMSDLTLRPATPVASVAVVTPGQHAQVLMATIKEMTKIVGMPADQQRVLNAAAYLASRLMAKAVLGQYVPEWQAPGRSGLYLVKPNIEAQARKIGVKPVDMAKYVSLHEATHHWQFTANPWLEKYMHDSITSLVKSGGANPLMARGATSKFAELNAAMSLVEGHANFMADQLADPEIRAVHTAIADYKKVAPSQSWVVKLLTKVGDMGTKSRQYTDGEKFCEYVHSAGGHALLDKAWTDVTTLPSADDIAHPEKWVARMTSTGGTAAAA